MNQKLSMRSILAAAWTDFKREKKSLFILTLLYLVLTSLYSGTVYLSMQMVQVDMNFVVIKSIGYILSIFLTVYGIFLNKNSLDIVYHRPLNWFIYSPLIKIYI